MMISNCNVNATLILSLENSSVEVDLEQISSTRMPMNYGFWCKNAPWWLDNHELGQSFLGNLYELIGIVIRKMQTYLLSLVPN